MTGDDPSEADAPAVAPEPIEAAVPGASRSSDAPRPRDSSPARALDGAPSRPIWFVPAFVVVVVLALVSFSITSEAVAVRSEEAELWSAAQAEPSEAAWQSYVTWADEIRVRGGARSMLATRLTQVWERAPHAAAQIVVVRVERASTREDWPALCAIRSEHPGTLAHTAATAALTERLDGARDAFELSARAHAMRPNALGAVLNALDAVRADDPCADAGVLQLEHSIDATSADLDWRLPSGTSVRTLLERTPTARRTSAFVDVISREFRGALGGAYGLALAADEETVSRTHLVIDVRAVLHAHERYVTRAGVDLPGLALRVSVQIFARASGGSLPTEPDYQTSADITVPAEIAAALTNASGTDGTEAAYTRVLDELDARLTERVREELGLANWSGPSARYYDCSDAEPLPTGRIVRATTRGDTDRTYGTCSIEYQNAQTSTSRAPETPEVIYRLVVSEQSIAAVQAYRDDHEVVAYVRSECASVSSEVACAPEGRPAVATLDPGVYYVFVDGTGGSAGRFQLAASLHDATRAPHACDEAPTLALDTDVAVDTSHGLDDMEGTCGGVGSPERVYAIDVSAPSRLRCTRTSETDAVLYLRSECGERASEIACDSAQDAPLRASLTAARHYLVVDGHVPGDRGRHTIRCELADTTSASTLAADTCASAGAIRSGSTLATDTFRAHDDVHGSCGGSGGADLVYRLVLEARAHVRVTASGASSTVLYLQRACGDAGSELACSASGALEADLDAGTYYLAVDSSAADFGARSIHVEQIAL